MKGQSACAAYMFFNAFLAFTLSFLLIRNNIQLGRKQDDVVDRDQRSTTAAENYGPNFLHVL